ncbi:MAG TPA: MFS transporter [Kofleriaceae bacterium]|nr:MFS transporter [Kofleriaceae bacterium]
MGPVPGRHPRGLLALAAVMACEAVAYYAVRSSAVFILVDAVGMEAVGSAFALIFTFVGLASGLLAGPAVDLAGPRSMAIVGSAITAAGALLLALTTSAPAIHVGLGLVVAGETLAEIAVVVLVADLYEPGDGRRDAGFTLFAVGAELGGLLAAVSMGIMEMTAGRSVGFAAVGAIPILGIVLLARRPPAPVPAPMTSRSAGRAVAVLAILVLVVSVIEGATSAVPPAFHTPIRDLELFGLSIPLGVWVPAAMIATMSTMPLVAWLWLRMGERGPSSPAKLCIGAVLSAAGAVCLVALSRHEGLGGRLMPPLIGILAGPFVRPIALSLLTRFAPHRLRGTAVGLWFCAPLLMRYPLGEAQIALAPVSPGVLAAVLAGAALAAGAVGYALLVRLGAGRSATRSA